MNRNATQSAFSNLLLFNDARDCHPNRISWFRLL